jgi:PAS domain S-box-containing protein
VPPEFLLTRGKNAAVLIAGILTLLAFLFAYDAIRDARSQAVSQAQLELGRVVAAFSGEAEHAFEQMQLLLDMQAEGVPPEQAAGIMFHPRISNTLTYSRTGDLLYAQYSGQDTLSQSLVSLMWRELPEVRGAVQVLAVQGYRAYPQLVMYRAAVNAAGKDVLLCGLIDTQHLAERFLDGSLSTEFTVGLVRADGSLLVAWNDLRSALRGMSLSTLDVPPRVRAELLRGGGVRRTVTDDALYQAVQLPSFSYYMVASTRMQSVMELVQPFVMRTVILAAGLWVVGIFLTIVVYRHSVSQYDLALAELQCAQRDELANLFKALVTDVQAAPEPAAAMEVFLRRLCERTGFELGAVYLPDQQERYRFVIYQSDSFHPIARNPGKGMSAPDVLRAHLLGLMQHPVFLQAEQNVVVPDMSVDERFAEFYPAGEGSPAQPLLKTVIRGACVSRVRRASVGHVHVGLFSLVSLEKSSDVAGLLDEVMPLLGPVAESKLAEVHLREQEMLFRNLYDRSALVQVVVNPETGRVLDANMAACEFYGYPHEVFVTQTLYDLWQAPRDDIDAVMSASTELYTGLHIQKHILAGGDLKDVEAYMGRVPWKGQHALLCAVFDRSGIKKMEAALLRSEQQLAMLMEKLPLALALLDETGTIRQVNGAFVALTGRTAICCTGRYLHELGLESLHEASCPVVQDALLPAGREPQELLLVTLQGEERHVLVHTTRLQMHEEGTRYAAFIVDMTERRRLDDLVVQSEKMASVGGLAAGMAHEINNPLGGIMQGAQNIIRRLDPHREANRAAAQACGCPLEAIRAYLEQRGILRFIGGIEDSARRAARITSNMLEFSRPCAGEWRKARLEHILDVALELAANDYDLKKRYDFRTIRIVRDYSPDVPAVRCIVSEVEQVALNLLRNAAQAMTEAATEAPAITLRTRVDGEYAVFEVEDNGPGMSREVARRVFEPFFTTREPGRGTGLGLSVSYFIITATHKGAIAVQARPDRGTAFVVRLPLRSAECLHEEKPAVEN